METTTDTKSTPSLLDRANSQLQYTIFLHRTREGPENWRTVSVTPVFKKGKKKDPGNYRTVRFTFIPGKVMEQLVLDAISKQLEEKKVIRGSQRGFTKGRSYSTNLLAFYDVITGWVDGGK